MKKNLRSLVFTLIALLLCTLLVSFILSCLYLFNLLLASLALISKIAGFIILLICGYLLGKNINERTLIYASLFALAGFLVGLLFGSKDLADILILAAKWLLFIITAMLSRSR